MIKTRRRRETAILFGIIHHTHQEDTIFIKYLIRTLKLSYSSTKNMASLIATHNWSILNPNDQVYGCNCRVRNDCLLQHKSLTPGIVYQATLTNSKGDVEKIYCFM